MLRLRKVSQKSVGFLKVAGASFCAAACCAARRRAERSGPCRCVEVRLFAALAGAARYHLATQREHRPDCVKRSGSSTWRGVPGEWADHRCHLARRPTRKTHMVESLIADILFGFTGLISIINPIGIAFVFLDRTASLTTEERTALARQIAHQRHVRAAGGVFYRHADPAFLRHFDGGAAHRRRPGGGGRRLADAQCARHAAGRSAGRQARRCGECACPRRSSRSPFRSPPGLARSPPRWR